MSRLKVGEPRDPQSSSVNKAVKRSTSIASKFAGGGATNAHSDSEAPIRVIGCLMKKSIFDEREQAHFILR